MDAWAIIWQNDLAICERCGSVVDVWLNKDVKTRNDENLSK